MKRRVRVVFDWILGLTLLAIGVAGLVLPILQGWVFILAGLAVLSSHSVWARTALDWLKEKGRAVKTRVVEGLRDR
ncbi:MAG TPA: PGPGW domain-containing protein [Candidatus Polarisedimenticolaceae bacterium]|nr:PGPGW domain-containing protein [Candidatus Polarisedimenticolaceae bacterium]